MISKQTLIKAGKTTGEYALAAGIGLFASSVYAAGGGLNSATTEATNIKTWLYGILGIGVFLYLMYLVIMALMDKKQWADVGMGLVYTAAAGGILVAGEWAWSIWGTASKA
jgi:hypothetical protein